MLKYLKCILFIHPCLWGSRVLNQLLVVWAEKTPILRGLVFPVVFNVGLWAHSSSALNLWESSSEAGAGFVSCLAGVWVSSGLLFPCVKTQLHFEDLVSFIQQAVTRSTGSSGQKELQGALRREASLGGRQSRGPRLGWLRRVGLLRGRRVEQAADVTRAD